MGCFADDPVAFFARHSLFVHHLPLAQQEALQVEALQQRFAAMAEALPPLKALVEASGTREIRRLEDVAPLMFPHTLFKSYPGYLLDDLRFPELTEWLSRLTLVDLSPVRDREFDAIDHWMDALDAETGLAILTSSGTTEALSLLPRGKREGELLAGRTLVEWQAPGASTPVRPIGYVQSMVWLSYASGRSGMLRSAEVLARNYTTAATRFIPLIAARASTDWQHHTARAIAAHRRGLPSLEPSPYVREKAEEAAEIQRTYRGRVLRLLEVLRDEMGGRPVHMAGGLPLIHGIAQEGLKLGMEPGLAAGSRVSTGGGMKGVVLPPDREKTIKRFTGVDKLYEAYGMTEIGDAFGSCEHGRFHVWPWIVPLVLDERSGALLPRRGKQRGRAAFFDLTAQTYWGGVVTADLVTVTWDTCPCARTTPQVIAPISRIQAGEGEIPLGCATPTAMRLAMEALNGGLS